MKYAYEGTVEYCDMVETSAVSKIGMAEGCWHCEIEAVIGGRESDAPEQIVRFDKFEMTLDDGNGNDALFIDLNKAMSNHRRMVEWAECIMVSVANGKQVTMSDYLIEEAEWQQALEHVSAP